MPWPFRRKSLIPGEPRSGFTTVESPLATMVLHEGQSVSYTELYRRSPAVRAVVDFLAQNVAQTPLHAFIRSGASGRDRLPAKDPLESLLRQPNARTSGFEWRRDAVTDLCLSGNAYSVKVRDAAGTVGSLVRVPPDRVSLIRTDTTEPTKFRVRFGSGEREFDPADVLHVRGFAPDGLLGVSPLESLRAVLAEDHAATRNRAGLWANAARREGVIERPIEAPPWSDEAREAFRLDWQATMSGAAKAGKTAILEESMTWRDSSFSAKDAEFVAGRDQVLRFVASVYSVPLQLLGGSERNLDAAQRGLVLNGLAPWFTLLEDSLDRDLVLDVAGEQAVYGRVFTEFVVEARSRGSFLQHAEIIERAVGGPYMTVNEARAKFNLPPVDGGDVVSREAKMIPSFRHRLNPGYHANGEPADVIQN